MVRNINFFLDSLKYMVGSEDVIQIKSSIIIMIYREYWELQSTPLSKGACVVTDKSLNV